MIGTILSFLGPLALKLIDYWFKKQEVNEDMKKSYYNFLEQLDRKGMIKISNFMGAEKSRQELKEKIRRERLEREKKQT